MKNPSQTKVSVRSNYVNQADYIDQKSLDYHRKIMNRAQEIELKHKKQGGALLKSVNRKEPQPTRANSQIASYESHPAKAQQKPRA